MPPELATLEKPLSILSSPSHQTRGNNGKANRHVLLLVRWPVGGIRTHLLYTIPRLVEAGCRFTLVLPNDISSRVLSNEFKNCKAIETVEVPITRSKCNLARTAKCLLRHNRFDLIHSHGMTAAIHGVLGNLWRGVPHLVTLHEPLRDQQFPGLLGPCKRWLLGKLLQQTQRIITVSGDSQRNLISHLPCLCSMQSRLQTIPHGIDLHDIGTESRYDLRGDLGLAQGTALLGYLGRFMPEKGFGILVEAVEILAHRPNIKPFHLVAFGSGDLRRKYENEIQQRSLGRFITLRDFVPTVQPVLSQFDLLVVPSLWEASSLVSMEAMTMGIPVLGSDCAGLREVLFETPSRTVSAGNSHALAEGLESALHNPWAQEARDFIPQARHRFGIEAAVRKLLKVYGEVIEQSFASC